MPSIVSGAQYLIGSIISVVLGVFQGAFGLFQASFGILYHVITTALHVGQDIISTAVHLVTRIIQSVADLVGGTLELVIVRTASFTTAGYC